MAVVLQTNLCSTHKNKGKMKPDIGIPIDNLKNINILLSTVLANEMTLYVKTRKFHWNLRGASFMELHKLFEDQYKLLEEFIDEVAERIGKLGGNTIGTMNEFQASATLTESPGKYPFQEAMLKELLDDHETMVRQLRVDLEKSENQYDDAGTTDFLTGIMLNHETIAWILRRYLM
jgi:starvation-inducible DNA-binding protein